MKHFIIVGKIIVNTLVEEEFRHILPFQPLGCLVLLNTKGNEMLSVGIFKGALLITIC